MSNIIRASAADGRGFGVMVASARQADWDRLCSSVGLCALQPGSVNNGLMKLFGYISGSLSRWDATDLSPAPSVKVGELYADRILLLLLLSFLLSEEVL